MQEIKFARLVVFINSLVPIVLLGWDAYHHRLGANPLEFVTHTTGTLTLVFLLISLAVTPLRKLLGLPWLNKAPPHARPLCILLRVSSPDGLCLVRQIL